MKERNGHRLKFPPNYWLFVAITFIGAIALQEAIRLAFMLRHVGSTVGIPGGTLAWAFLVGLRFDILIASFMWFLPAVFIPFGRLIERAWFRALSVLWVSLCYAIFIVVGIVDMEYFANFGSHLSIWAIEYLDQFGMIVYMAQDEYPLIAIGIGILLACVVLVISVAAILKSIRRRFYTGNVFLRIAFFIVTILLLICSARGNLGLAPADWGMAYFSNHHFANQLALNGCYTLTKTIQETSGCKQYTEELEWFTQDEALSIARQMVAAPRDSFIDESSIERIIIPDKNIPSNKFNIVIIMLESWSAGYVSCLDGPPGITPRFDSLTANNILLSNFWATGTRSNRGILSLLFGFPSPPGRSLLKRYMSDPPYISIAQSLEPFGYTSLFLYGGDLAFDNMGGALNDGGFDKVIGLPDFQASQSVGKWGVPDGVAFQRFFDELEIISEPFAACVFTLTSHEPFDMPPDFPLIYNNPTKEQEYLNTIHYADSCLGAFFDMAASTDWFDNTIFILSADHGHSLHGKGEIPPSLFKNAGAIVLPKALRDTTIYNYTIRDNINKICSQSDILPTAYTILNLPIQHACWGRNIFIENSGWAYCNRNSSVAIVSDSVIIVENCDLGKIFVRKADNTDEENIYIFGSEPQIDSMLVNLRAITQVVAGSIDRRLSRK